jgi:hypothetical protein
MPFPLAHPAAILPLRPFCQKHLNLAALVIGSLTPDLGYASGHLRVDLFSHRFAGSFGFCLPVGLILVAAFYRLRRPLVGVLPEGYRQAFLAACRRPAGSLVAIIVSVLLGAWTHILLDSITHADGWLVEHLAFLRISLPWTSRGGLSIYALLYAACTFGGILWLAHAYLRWLDASLPRPGSRAPQTRWGWSLALAGGVLLIAEFSRGSDQMILPFTASLLAGLLVVGFVLATGLPFRKSRG